MYTRFYQVLPGESRTVSVEPTNVNSNMEVKVFAEGPSTVHSYAAAFTLETDEGLVNLDDVLKVQKTKIDSGAVTVYSKTDNGSHGTIIRANDFDTYSDAVGFVAAYDNYSKRYMFRYDPVGHDWVLGLKTVHDDLEYGLELDNQSEFPITVTMRAAANGSFENYTPKSQLDLATYGTELKKATIEPGKRVVFMTYTKDVELAYLTIDTSQAQLGQKGILHVLGRAASIQGRNPAPLETGTTVPGGGSPATPTPIPPVNNGDDVSLIYKAFLSVGDLANNSYRDVAPVGELSNHSRTFTRDRVLSSSSFNISQSGTDGKNQGLNQVVFSCRKVAAGTPSVPPDPALIRVVEMIGNWVYRAAYIGQLSNDPEELRTLLMSSTYTMTDIVVGEMVQYQNVWYPTTLNLRLKKAVIQNWYQSDSGQSVTLPNDYDTVEVRLWFSDQKFQQQFDEFEIAIVGPLDNLDGFFNTAQQVNALLEVEALNNVSDKIRAVADGDPYTDYMILKFNWYDQVNVGNKIPTDWHFVIYGEAGRSVDAIKEVLRKWILEKSTRTRDEWIKIFPDIFRNTEFIFAPMWSRYAIPNETLIEGVYKPVLDYQDAFAIAQKTVVGHNYTTAHLANKMAFITTPYKSLSMVVCAGPENRQNAKVFDEVWRDYISVPTNDPDFGRMQTRTQAWVNRFHQLLRAAEEDQDGSAIPSGITRVKRTNKANQTVTYVSANVDNIQYMVVTKQSMNAIIPPSTDPIQHDDMTLILLPSSELTLETRQGSRALSVDFEAIGGRAPYTYSITPTDDMQAHAVGTTTGHVEITYKTTGQFPLKVKVNDARNDEYIATYTVDVRP